MHYAIGDIQGCYDEFIDLLEVLHFNPEHDQLWLVGDLLNRGPKSLEVLRLCYQLESSVRIVLGNHDLHFLAIHYGIDRLAEDDTLSPVLHAKDCAELANWLLHQPLLHHDPTFAMTMVHAGIPPQWSLPEALALAKEAETLLTSEQPATVFAQLFQNTPLEWSESLTGWERLRYIINAFTRMRFCTEQGQLLFKWSNQPGTQPPGYAPWFEWANRRTQHDTLLFGHWAALSGRADVPRVYALDTGCVWGRTLSALCLETKTITQIDSRQPKKRK